MEELVATNNWIKDINSITSWIKVIFIITAIQQNTFLPTQTDNFQ